MFNVISAMSFPKDRHALPLPLRGLVAGGRYRDLNPRPAAWVQPPITSPSPPVRAVWHQVSIGAGYDLMNSLGVRLQTCDRGATNIFCELP